MTDRHAGYIVTLREDRREDDAEAIVTALRMVAGVAHVEPIVANIDLHIAEQRAKDDLGRRVIEAVVKEVRA